MRVPSSRGIVCLTFLLLALCLQLHAAASSHEETVVLRTYARLAQAVQLNTLYEAATNTADVAEINKRVSDAELQFSVSNVKVGDLAEIAAVSYGDLVTKPSGAEALSVGVHTINDGPSASSTLAGTPAWITEQDLQEDWSVPFSKAIPAIEQQNGGIHLQRYCSYSVRLSFLGKSRTYKAMFLFGKDAIGTEAILPLDMGVNVNGQALTFFSSHGVRTDALTHGKLKNAKAVADWIAAHLGSAQ